MTDTEWQIVGPLIPEPKTNGRQATIPRRRLLDARFYVTKTGCGWEWLPHDFPKKLSEKHWNAFSISARHWDGLNGEASSDS